MTQNKKISKETAEFLLKKAQFINNIRCGHADLSSQDAVVLFDVVNHIERVLNESYSPVKFNPLTGKFFFTMNEEA